MNSRKTLTCNLCNLPQDIFRVIFQYLSPYELMRREEAFLNNQQLLSLYRSALKGFTLKGNIYIKKVDEYEDEDDDGVELFLPWIIDRKLLVEKLELTDLRDLDMGLLNQSRSSLKSITFNSMYCSPSPLGHFPSLTSITFKKSNHFTQDQLISFFSHNPQLQNVKIKEMRQLSNDFLPLLSNYCPNIKILSLKMNNWVNDKTISLLTQQRLFPNLKSLDIRWTKVTNQESLRQFILSRPLLSGLLLPNEIQYSNDFLLFYLRQFLFPSILNQNNNNNDLESHSLAISSLFTLIRGRIFHDRNHMINPEIFSLEILSHIYHKDSSIETHQHAIQVFYHLSTFPSMINSILQSQFIPSFLNHTGPHDYHPFSELLNLLFCCCNFREFFPLLVEKYRTHPSALIQIFRRAIKDHFSLLTTEELKIITPIMLNNLQIKAPTYNCLEIITKILQEPSSQHLIDPNSLLLSLKSIKYSNQILDANIIDCLKTFLSVGKNYQQLFIESNLTPHILKLMNIESLINFTRHCFYSFRDRLLIDHLVDSGLFHYLLSHYHDWDFKRQIEYLFIDLIECNKYSEMVKAMNLPNGLRKDIFERGWMVREYEYEDI